jgi:iron complex outermembrane receptor protein
VSYCKAGFHERGFGVRLFIGTSALALALGAAVGAQAQVSSGEVGELVVTASRTGSTVEQLPVSVSVTPQAEVARQLEFSPNIMRALEFTVPGLAPQQGGRVNCTRIRGRLAAIQINGVPVTEDLRQSTCDQAYQLSPFAIERVEVIRGGTALYGSGAPGGIINFVTRRARGEALEVDAVAQTSFNTSATDDTFTSNLYLGAGQRRQGWDYYVGVGYTGGQGARTPDGDLVPARAVDGLSLNASVGAAAGGGELRATAAFYAEEKGRAWVADGGQSVGGRLAVVTQVTDHPQADDNLLRSVALAVAYTHPSAFGHELSVSGFLQDQLFRQRDNFFRASFGDDFLASDSENERLGFRSALTKRAQVQGADLVLSYGFDYTWARYYRPQLDTAGAGRIIGYISPQVSLRTSALFAQAEAGFGRFRLVGGVRQEWYSGQVGAKGYDPTVPQAARPGAFNDTKLALFNVGAVYELTPAVQLYGGFSQGAELSQLGRAVRGVQDPARISPEPASSDQYEVGFRGRLDQVRFEAAAFYSSSERAALLQADPSCADQSFCSLIPLRAAQRFRGFEGSVEIPVTAQVDLRGVVTWQRGEIFEAAAQRYVDYSSDIVAPLRIIGAVDVRPTRRMSATLQGAYYGPADYLSPADQAFGRISTDDVVLFDASVRHEFGPGQLFLAASNLLDQKYVNVAGQASGAFAYYRAEGRRVTLGYRARF